MWKGGERLKKSGFFSEFTSRYLPWIPEVFFRVRRGPFSDISLEYKVKPSKNHDGKFQFTSIYKASPVDFETQISLRRSATPNIIPSKLSPSKRAFEKISPGAYFRNFTVAQVFKTSTIEVLCEVVELRNPRTAYVWHIPNTLNLVSARNNHKRKF